MSKISKLNINTLTAQDNLKLPRLGNSMVQYNNNIIIYGGCPTSLDRKKRSHISFHPLIFNINTNKLNAL